MGKFNPWTILNDVLVDLVEDLALKLDRSIEDVTSERSERDRSDG